MPTWPATYEELQAKVAEQEETIKLLRMLLEEKGLGLAATSLEFQRLIEKQGEQFQKFIQGLGESVKPEDPQPEGGLRRTLAPNISTGLIYLISIRERALCWI